MMASMRLTGRGKTRGVVLLDPDFRQGLEVAELKSYRLPGYHLGGVGQLGGRLELAVGVNDLGALFTLRLGLLGHGPLHLLRQVHCLDFDQGDLDPPGVGLLVQDVLELLC